EARTDYDWDKYGRLLHERREGLSSAADVQVYYKWDEHRKSCEVWCGGDSNLACPSENSTTHEMTDACTAATLGCDAGKLPQNYDIVQTYQSGNVKTVEYRGVGWKSSDVDVNLSGDRDRVRDSISQYAREMTYDLFGRVTAVAFKNSGTAEERQLDI